MQFPASDSEKKLVHEKMHELKLSLIKSEKLSEELESLLSENFLAISKENKKRLEKYITKIGAAFWRLGLQTFKMEHHKERIVNQAEQEAGQGLDLY